MRNQHCSQRSYCRITTIFWWFLKIMFCALTCSLVCENRMLLRTKNSPLKKCPIYAHCFGDQQYIHATDLLWSCRNKFVQKFGNSKEASFWKCNIFNEKLESSHVQHRSVRQAYSCVIGQLWEKVSFLKCEFSVIFTFDFHKSGISW